METIIKVLKASMLHLWFSVREHPKKENQKRGPIQRGPKTKGDLGHNLRSENKVQYEHILIHENQFVGQILSQISDLELPLFYVYMVYKSPQMMLNLDFQKFLPVGHLCFIPADSAHALVRP